MSIDEIITQISNLQSQISNDEDYILYPNPNYTPITDSLPDGTLVAYDEVSRLWSTRDMRLYRLEKDGSWTKKYISFWEQFVRKPNNHSHYPRVSNYSRLFGAHAITARAWIGHVPPGYQTDHIDGDNKNFNITNLRLLPIWMNHRDGGFLRLLRHHGINPTTFAREYLLRFFKRLALFKNTNPYADYCRLSHDDLLRLLVSPEFIVGEPLDPAAEPHKYADE
ncbi:MAG: HNH endonuclease [Paludibacteraceae bacterium]|nr:HNH endonuclease [Paludibacteraceae bacterium]MBQ3997968.1 HNH endonuclease [Paludibacteraceae bacterium]